MSGDVAFAYADEADGQIPNTRSGAVYRLDNGI